jgi:arylsulfatase A-like enzyme
MRSSLYLILFGSLAGAALAAGAASAQRESAVRRPNVVVILADDLGYGDLSSFGARDMDTPNIDRLVADGIRFDRFYANSPVCSPTRAALLSGRYPDLVGVPGVIRTQPEDNWGYLSPQATLLPKVLQRAGYHTALVGKWHLGLTPPNTPNERGFDHFHGFLGDMMDDYLTHRRHGNNYMRLNRREIDPPGHATDLFSDWAVDYVRERASRRDPFFLYLAYNAPHVPVQPPANYLERAKRRIPGDDRRARLAALIEHMDTGIGRVVAALKETGAYENTLIVFTSDNGGQVSAGASNGPLRGAKEDVYEGGIREPMCAVWPGHIRGGSRSQRVALTMDLFLTVCEAAGVKPPQPLDGVSLLPDLTGATRTDDRTLYWVRREGGARYQGKTINAVRRGDWKLVHNSPFEPMALFNLGTDPKEQTDVSAQNRQVFNELSAALRLQIQRAGAVPWSPPPVSAR